MLFFSDRLSRVRNLVGENGRWIRHVDRVNEVTRLGTSISLCSSFYPESHLYHTDRAHLNNVNTIVARAVVGMRNDCNKTQVL